MKDKRKVIFIVPNLYSGGGVNRVTTMIANALQNTGKYNVSILSINSDVNGLRYYIEDGIVLTDLGIEQYDIRSDTLKVARLLRKKIPSTFEGTVVVDDVGNSIPVWLGLRSNKNIRLICWSHMNFFNGSRWGFSGWGKRLAVKKFKYVIALTKEDKGYYDKILKADNVVQIYNPVCSEIKTSAYKADAKKIISCGRLNAIKGFDLLIEVARKVFNLNSNWIWDIYGEGPEKEALQNKIKLYGLQDRVFLRGYREDILDLYKEYSLDVFTSRGEGCPMAMIEAQSAGLPIISFDFKCGPKDLITDGENGYIIPDWDIDLMANKIADFIQNRKQRIYMAINAKMNLNELDLTFVLKQWEKIL